MIGLPGFEDVPLHELRRLIADFKFQRDVAGEFLERAETELRHRKQEKKEGVVKLTVVHPPKRDPTSH